MDKATTDRVLVNHRKWLKGEADGVRANLSGANLSDADLSRADLSRADLSGADLSGADLSRADLSDANLIDANLSGANLSGADLSGADLSDANLSGANLSDADLSDAKGARAPIVEGIDAAILAAIADGGGLNMDNWHSCQTTHCRAGWAIHLAGPAGYGLEDRIGACAAGALIYAASRPGVRVPDFYASNEAAISDIRKFSSAAVEDGSTESDGVEESGGD